MAKSGIGNGWRPGRLVLLAAVALALIAIVYAATRRDPATGASPAPVNATGASTNADADPEALIRALQERVGANPNDAEAWQRLGQAYFLMQRYADAARAYRRATTLRPGEAGLWSAFGEACVMESERDPMPADALAAFRKASGIDPKDARARYFLAVARDLRGDHEGAIDDWLTLLKDTPAGAPWELDLRRTVEQVGKINRIDVSDRLAAVRPAPAPPATAAADAVATAGIPGPTREQMQAASGLPKGAQDQMVQGMVDGLEGKLRADPKNVDGWIMLMRSRMTLGETAKAAAARDSALLANPSDGARIRAAARTLGVPGS